MIESIDSKLISVFLINDYSLIAQLHIFVYERAEFSSISLECTKAKLSILDNFALALKNKPLTLKNNYLAKHISCSIKGTRKRSANEQAPYKGKHW